jgi:hypothetical protein
VFGIEFKHGVEHQITKERYDYLKKLVDKRLVDQGNTKQIINVPIFAVREQEYTTEQKVLEEIKDAPDSLRPKRRKEAE